jgi:5-methylcytosine-specific restriction endonuclease McrA
MIDNKMLAQEKQKARELRKSRWWKEKIASCICEYCGKTVPADELTMDHVVPLARGGKSAKNNIVAACKDCNNKKKYLLPAEWDEYINKK